MKLKYILVVVIAIALIILAVTIGADNDQVISFNYLIAQSEMRLSTLVAILFGLGLLLGWAITGIFYLRLRLRLMGKNRQIKRQEQKIKELLAAQAKAE